MKTRKRKRTVRRHTIAGPAIELAVAVVVCVAVFALVFLVLLPAVTP